MQEAAKEEDVQALERAFEILNIYLQDSQYVAGDEITIADFTIITSVCSMVVSINHFKYINFHKFKWKFNGIFFTFPIGIQVLNSGSIHNLFLI